MQILRADYFSACPYGREINGYEVANLVDILAKAKAAGVGILVAP